MAAGHDDVVGACPEAETLAAFVERTLPQAEALAFEQHAAGCARCQQALAVIASMPVEAAPTADTASAPARWARWFDWRWLAPLGAIGGIAIAVSVVAGPAPANRIDVAGGAGVSRATPDVEALPPAAPKSMANSEATASPAADVEGQASVMAGPPPPASPNPVRSGEAAAPPVAASVEAPVPAEASPSSVAPSRAERRAADAATLAEAGAAPEMARAKRLPPHEETSPPSAPAAPVAQVTMSPPPPSVVAGSVPAPSPEVAPAPAALPAAGVGPAGQAKAAYATGVAPVRWRVGPGGRLERTTDAGRSWQPQASGVTADLLASDTVSARVAWAVGAAGTVLRTTDGERWDLCAVPVEDDIVAVTATSATHAVVTSRDGHRFTTVDGCQTWRPAR